MAVKKFLKRMKARFDGGGLEPDDLDKFEPLPYIRRLIKQRDDAAVSGFLTGVFFMSFLATMTARSLEGSGWFMPAHGAGMLFMAGTLVIYLIINMHRLRWLPVAFLGIIALIIGQFI